MRFVLIKKEHTQLKQWLMENNFFLPFNSIEMLSFVIVYSYETDVKVTPILLFKKVASFHILPVF